MLNPSHSSCWQVLALALRERHSLAVRIACPLYVTGMFMNCCFHSVHLLGSNLSGLIDCESCVASSQRRMVSFACAIVAGLKSLVFKGCPALTRSLAQKHRTCIFLITFTGMMILLSAAVQFSNFAASSVTSLDVSSV